MKASVLLSGMNFEAPRMLKKSNLTKNTILVDQCNVKKEKIKNYSQHIKKINTPTRGLSVSRNIALKNTTSDIAILADDDEYFVNDVQDKVVKVYQQNPGYDVIVFKVENLKPKDATKKKRIRLLDSLKVASVQITFKTKSIKDNHIKFDPKLGVGTSNGGGEENKFLVDCLKANLHILYVPVTIAKMRESVYLHNEKSGWFKGYTNEFFYQRGSTTRYTFGLSFAIIYAFYFLIFKRKEYTKDISVKSAAVSLFSGIKDNKLLNSL